MLFHYDLPILLVLIPSLIFSLSFHEFAHAFAAYKLGDMTAKNQGRLTLNPLAHIDPIGGLMVLMVGFGWAKPVPVDLRQLKNPSTAMMKVAFAGPLSNLILALLGGLVVQASQNILLSTVFLLFTQINVALALFNLLPFPPLDGSQILSGFLVRYNPELVYKLQMHGPKVLLGLILIGAVTKFSPIWWLIGSSVKALTMFFIGKSL